MFRPFSKVGLYLHSCMLAVDLRIPRNVFSWKGRDVQKAKTSVNNGSSELRY